MTPQDCIGPVVGDLEARRGQVQGQDFHGDTRGNAMVINATVPLSNMFDYADKLRTMSQGRATFAMQFDRYEKVPLLPDDDPSFFPPAIGMRA